MPPLDDLLRQRLGPAAPAWTLTPQRRAAVLCPFVSLDGIDHLLLLLRPHTLRVHAGQIGFPGGKADGDEDPVACAQRECGEELGAPAAAIRVLGSLPPRESSSGLLVHCLVGRLQPVPLRPEPREVARLLYVPFAELQDDARWQDRTPPPTATGRQPPTSPHFAIGEEMLWGLTARFVRELVQRLR